MERELGKEGKKKQQEDMEEEEEVGEDFNIVQLRSSSSFFR